MVWYTPWNTVVYEFKGICIAVGWRGGRHVMVRAQHYCKCSILLVAVVYTSSIQRRRAFAKKRALHRSYMYRNCLVSVFQNSQEKLSPQLFDTIPAVARPSLAGEARNQSVRMVLFFFSLRSRQIGIPCCTCLMRVETVECCVTSTGGGLSPAENQPPVGKTTIPGGVVIFLNRFLPGACRGWNPVFF